MGSLISRLSKDCVHTSVYVFADDLKLLSSNPRDLQLALKIVETWSKEWNLPIQPDKSEHLFIPYTRNYQLSSNIFFINHTEIQTKEYVKDLGLILSKDLKWSKYISSISTKATITAHTVLRAFQTNNIDIIINLYKMYVRPTLEYNTSIWNPNYIKDINCIENVQRRFTKRLCQKNNIKFNSYTERLQLLNLETLESRRLQRDVILMFKIYHNLIDVNFQEFFSASISSSNYNLRGNSFRLHLPKHSGSTVRHNFFTNRILNIWNDLPDDLLNSPTLTIFKFKLKQLDLTRFLTSFS